MLPNCQKRPLPFALRFSQAAVIRKPGQPDRESNLLATEVFTAMSSHFRLTLQNTEPTASVIGLLRRHTAKPIAFLRQAITTRQPFLDEAPHHNQYSEFITNVTELVDDLEAEGIAYLVEIDGSPSPDCAPCDGNKSLAHYLSCG